MSKSKKNKNNQPSATTESAPKTDETKSTTPKVDKVETSATKGMTPLQRAQEKAKANLTRSSSMTDIVEVLRANKGQTMTGQEIASAIGDTVTAASVRHKMQKQGLSSRTNGVIEVGNDWVHLTKLDGGLNGYKLTDPILD